MSADPIRASFRRHVFFDCQVVREHDFRLVGDLAHLSTGGMLVRACDRILTGEELVISFKLTLASRRTGRPPPAYGALALADGALALADGALALADGALAWGESAGWETRWFDVQGCVARVLHGRRPGDPRLAFGVEFHNMSFDDELVLFEALRGLAPPDPQRPPRPLLRAA